MSEPTYTISPHSSEFEPSPRWVRVYFNKQLIADSKKMMLLRESNHLPLYYFPKKDVRMDCLQPNDHAAHSDRKGEGIFWHVQVGDTRHEGLAWIYRYPTVECAKIQGLVSFLNEKVNMYEDGTLLPRPKTIWS